MNNLMSLYQQLMSNPGAMLRQRFNIPDGVNMNDPNSIIQHLLNTGQITQAQVNQAMQMRNSPLLSVLQKK